MRPVMVCALFLAGVALGAQRTDPPAFEVVSVKRNVSGEQGSSSIVQPGGRYNATNMTLRMLMKTAYGVHDDQIAGGPGWINADRFDVAGKAAADRPTASFRDEARLMLRSALADRFQLQFHRERREIPVYALTLARRDGSFGPQLRRSHPEECSGSATDRPCGSGFARAGHLGARALDLSMLVSRLGTWTDRVLVDRTGLSGLFDWDLQWTPEDLTADASTNVALVTALREQLGLKLDARREPADVLVIDRVARPELD